MSTGQPNRAASATIEIRTQVRGQKDLFEHWQRELGQAAATFPGFIDQAVLPPTFPEQTYWTTLQWFDRSEDAIGWLNSDRRRDLLAAAPASLLDPDDIRIIRERAEEGSLTGASAIITTRIKPGCEAVYRTWQQRIAAALSLAPGFRGYRFEPPIPNVQEAWLVIMQFDTEADLEAWLGSSTRMTLVEEAASLTEDFRIRVARTGLDQWFRIPSGAAMPPAWKMSMLVLLVVYPTVFTFERLVGTPQLVDRGVPFWLSTFVGNVVCVTLMNWLIPWIGRRFRWWLEPPQRRVKKVTWQGVGVVVSLYIVCLLVFAACSTWVGLD